MKVGIGVTCAVCGRRKAPHGRSIPMALCGYLCDGNGCRGYADAPLPGCLWPGETEGEFGYPICDNATREEGGEQ